MSPQDFANAIRNKYPAGTDSKGVPYGEISDVELSRRWISANPEYKEQVEMPKVNLEKALPGFQSVESRLNQPIPEEKPNAIVENLNPFSQTNRDRLLDIPSDVSETFDSMKGNVSEAMQNSREVRARVASGETEVLEGAGQILGGGFKAGAGIVGDAVIGTGKVFATQETEDRISQTVADIGEQVADTEVAKDLVQKYKSLSPEEQRNIDAFLGGAEGFGTMFGAGPVFKALRASLKPVVAGVDVGVDAARVAGPKVLDWTTTNVPAAAQAVYNKVPSMQSVLPNTTSISENLVAGINRITPSQRQNFKQMSGQSAEEWLVDRGLTGTRDDTLAKLSTNFQALRQNVDEALDIIPGEYRDKRVTVVAEEAAEYARSVEAGEASRMSSLYNKSKGVGLTTKEINEVKRYYERNIKVGYMKDQTQNAAAVELATNRDGALREYLFEISDQNGFSNLRELNKEIQQSRFLTDKIAGRMEGEGANNVMSLTDWIVITPGAIDPTFIAGFAVKKAFSTDTARSLVARLFNRREAKDLPKADLDEIQRLASERMARMDIAEQERVTNFLMAKDLQDAGFVMSDSDRAFVTSNPIPLTRQEQMMLKIAEEKGTFDSTLSFVLDKKAQGFEIGEGFIMREAQEALPAAGGTVSRQDADFNLGSRSQSTIDAQEMERVQSQNRPNTAQENTNTNSNDISNTDNTQGTLLEQALRLDRDSVQQAISEVEADLSGSTRPSVGQNFVQTADGGAYRFNELPSWIPDNLRSADLMARVLENITNNRKPRANATNEQQLQEIVENRIATRAESIRNEGVSGPVDNTQSF